MTPHERAEAAAELTGSYDINDDDIFVFAAAIRDAENDALERAATLAGDLYSPNKHTGVCDAIRALKHPVAPQEPKP